MAVTTTHATILFCSIVLLLLFFFAAFGIRIVRHWEKGVVERFGRYSRTLGSGLNLIIPFFERMHRVDLRETVIDVEPQQVITKDNVVVTVDAVVYLEIVDPFNYQYNVDNFWVAVSKLAQTNLRNVVGDMSLDECLVSRDEINNKLREVLDTATDKWGAKVTRVEIQRIDPPNDVTEAMHRQMKADAKSTCDHSGVRGAEAGGDTGGRRRERGPHSQSGRRGGGDQASRRGRAVRKTHRCRG